MKRFLILIFTVSLVGLIYAQALTCYDIQYTTNPNGNSPYMGQIVTVRGIVVAAQMFTGSSATNYGFVISDEGGGPWSGLLIFTNRYFPGEGDLVEVTGTIVEYFGLTEMTSVSSYTVVSTGNTVPAPTLVSTGTLANPATAEQWESCLVKVEDVVITTAPNNFLEFYVNDGTGAAQVDDQCFPRTGFSWPAGVAVGQNWARIQGVVDYSFDLYAINPRRLSDMLQVDSVANAQIKVIGTTAEINSALSVPLNSSRIKAQWGVTSFDATIRIDPSKLEFLGVDIVDALVQTQPEYELSDDGTEITFSYRQQDPISTTLDEVTLFKMLFKPVQYGETTISVQSFKYDNIVLTSLFSGKIMVPIRENIAFLEISNPNNSKNIFDPMLNEKLSITYGSRVGNAGINARVVVRIYDGKGRLVATPVNRVISSALGIETFLYDGRDSMMRYLSPGFYYCSLEIVDRETGTKNTAIQPIVIRANLK